MIIQPLPFRHIVEPGALGGSARFIANVDAVTSDVLSDFKFMPMSCYLSALPTLHFQLNSAGHQNRWRASSQPSAPAEPII